MANRFVINQIFNNTLNLGMQIAATFIVGNDSLFRAIECQTFTLCTRTHLGDIVKTKHHILRRNRDRSTIGWVQNVVALKHQYLCLKNSLIAQWKVNSHLVTIEVGIERRTSQWMKLDSLAFNKFWLESLNTQTVKCRCTVQHDRMTLHHVLKNIPDNRLTTVYNLLGTLNSFHDTALNKLTDNEWFIQFGSHEFRQTTLAHLQFRTYNDN